MREISGTQSVFLSIPLYFHLCRAYFQEAHDTYQQHGDASELYVIIIDEIEAICKPRGKP